MAESHGDSVGRYASALLDTPLPWTRMRQVYRLLGLVKKWGASRVDEACRRALDAEAVDVNLVSRMFERARESIDARGPTGSGRDPRSLLPRRVGVQLRDWGPLMSAPTPTVSFELKALMRKLRLGQLLDTLPERLASSAHSRPHAHGLSGATVLRRGDQTGP